MKILLITFLTGCFVLKGFGQEVTVSGIVRDKENGQPIRYGSVNLKLTGVGTHTSEGGKFNLSFPLDHIGNTLAFSSIGYQSDTVTLVKNKLVYQVFLSPVNSALNEVVVTGVSRATLVRENPIPIVSVSTQKIERATESNIIDVLVKNVPGLNAVKTGPNISKPFIRGLGYNRVLTLYDGIRQEGQQWGDEHGIEVDPYSIERAEVVKGPSSLIYGSDALAGVVGLIPVLADNTFGKITGKFYSEYQGNNSLIGNGIRFNYGNDHWSYALRGSYRVAKSYQNSIDGRVYNTGFKETNASGSVKYRNDKGYSSLNVTLYDDRQGIPDGSRDSVTRQFTYQVGEGSKDDILHRPVVPADVLNSYQQSPLDQHIQHYRIYTKNHYQLVKAISMPCLPFSKISAGNIPIRRSRNKRACLYG
jgi:iron complex outermembrane receptor protein